MAKVDYGAVALIPVGDYSASKQYHANELVGYHGSSYVALQNPPVGTLPTNTTYFMLHTAGTSIATASTPGTVKPDGTSTVVDASGAMSVKPSIVQTIQGTAEIAADTAEKVGAVPTGKTLQSQVDGLEPRVSSSEQALTVNLLNPTLESKTVNGVTITKNSDNTYTFNGTATADVSQTIGAIDASYFQHFDRIRLCGTPYTTGDNSGPRLFTNSNPPVREYGNGETLDATHLNVNLTIGAKIPSGFTCDNLVFKPMLTTNLSATYDDYVPYSGSSGKLDTDFKTLSQKIGNVGNTDLQSQLNAATQSIAQNTAISALNTGLATKIGTYETQQDNRILNIVHNINSDEIIAYDEKLATWFPIWSKPKLAGQAFFIPASNVEITYQAIFMYGKMRIVQLNLRLLTQFADGAEVATSTATAPINASYCTCRDGQNHLATFAFNPDRRLVCWGANPANTGNIYPIQLTYFV